MHRSRRVVVVLACSTLLASTIRLIAVDGAIDRWANAVGGRGRIAAVKAVYREATVTVAAFQGVLKVWHTADGKYRKEERVATFSTIETFDGNEGMVSQGDGPARVMRGVELEQLKSRRFANSNAMFFVFFPERHSGTRMIEGPETIVFRPAGGVDWRVTLDPATSLPATMVHQEPIAAAAAPPSVQGQRTVTVVFAGYETVDGIAFEKEIHRSNGDPRWDAVIHFTKTVINPDIDPSLFTLRSPPGR
jgi:hypothetical protein